MKYVIIDYNRAILFDESFVHKEFVYHGDITSSAYFSIIDDRVEVYGGSIGLGMECREEDGNIIAKRLGLICK